VPGSSSAGMGRAETGSTGGGCARTRGLVHARPLCTRPWRRAVGKGRQGKRGAPLITAAPHRRDSPVDDPDLGAVRLHHHRAQAAHVHHGPPQVGERGLVEVCECMREEGARANVKASVQGKRASGVSASR